jgi:hypothetical protein
MNDAAAVISSLPPKAAKMLAVEILLADPESLHDDVLESCLYLLRDRLTAETGSPGASPAADTNPASAQSAEGHGAVPSTAPTRRQPDAPYPDWGH